MITFFTWNTDCLKFTLTHWQFSALLFHEGILLMSNMTQSKSISAGLMKSVDVHETGQVTQDFSRLGHQSVHNQDNSLQMEDIQQNCYV